MFSCPEQLNRTHCLSVCLSVRPQQLTVSPLTTLQSDPRDLRPLRLLFKVLRTHDLLPPFTTILDNFDNFWQFMIVWTICESLDKFLTIWTILTNSDNSDHFYIFYNFNNWQRFSQFRQLPLPFLQMKRQSWQFFDIWDTDYNSDNWELHFLSIFVTWQFRVTLDSMCNSCDVYFHMHAYDAWSAVTDRFIPTVSQVWKC